MIKIKWILFFLLMGLLFYTRFVNLTWGLPYPMHPDERNMASAIQQLGCPIQNSEFRIQNCFNPHFFAYGQFPLFLGYGVVFLLKFFDGDLAYPISFEEAAISLRIISALASIINVFVLLKIVNLIIFNFQFSIRNGFFKNKFLKLKNLNLNEIFKFKIVNLLIFTFTPFFIQFSHFGTTESLLMLFYSLIVYLSVRYSLGKLNISKFLLLTSVICGMAIATKVSSVFFLIVPLSLTIDKIITVNKHTIIDRSVLIWFKLLLRLGYFIALTLVFSILFSPHNFISFTEFLGSMKYESDVALGLYRAFYTKQFELTNPIFFQFFKIFPHTLGWPVLIFFTLGFIFLPFKGEYNLLRLTILVGFLPNAFLYAKWTRFVSPIFPLMLVMAVLFIEFSIFNFQFLFKSKFLIFKHLKFNENFKFKISNLLKVLILLICIIPGVAYLSIYQNPDVRFTVSDWIYKNIPDGSYILSETANVVDPPVSTPNFKNPEKNYKYISFNFYDLDENLQIQSELKEHIVKADYIFIPSRRIFANYYCPPSLSIRGNEMTEKSSTDLIGTHLRFARFLADARNDKENVTRNDVKREKCEYLRKRYPSLNNYYDKLFSGELGFKKVAEFSSFPKIQLFGKTLLEFPDEQAEETWTVFDHPMFRIYKRI